MKGSLMATIFTSLFFWAALQTNLPIRPNPLIPTLMGLQTTELDDDEVNIETTDIHLHICTCIIIFVYFSMLKIRFWIQNRLKYL